MTSARKPSRIGLYAPFVLVLVAAVAWTFFWLWTRGETRTRMDAAAETLRRAGYEVSWGDRTFGGYPFRMDVTLTDARVREPSGWALEAPRLEGEAYMHGLGTWLVAAPESLTFVRPVGGPVVMHGKLIRASLSHFAARPLSFSFEGVDLAFQPAPGAQPFGLAAAGRLEIHTRAGPDDEGGLFITLDKGKAAPATLLGRIAGDRPVTLQWNATLSKMSAFTGSGWPLAVRHWADAGGRMMVRHAGITAGDASIAVGSGTLGVGADGRVSGELDATLKQAPRVLAALDETGLVPPEIIAAATLVAVARQGTGDTVHAAIDFQAGRTTLGPVAIVPAPKVYEIR
jgi:hypothetical protein